MYGPRPTVFVSYSSRDSKRVQEAVEHLRRSDVSVWFDDIRIVPGTRIIDALHEGLAESRILVLFVSVSSIKSSWVNYEWTLFIDQSLRRRTPLYLIPVKIGRVAMPDQVAQFRYIDASDDEYLEKLSSAIKTISIQDAERKRGYHVWLSEQVDRVRNKSHTILTQRTTIKPLSSGFSP